jgi:ketosteroid isomerase-like protein
MVTSTTAEGAAMTIETRASFDLDALRRGYEEWDIEALLALYADEVELIQIDRDHPPSSPRVRHGREVFKDRRAVALILVVEAGRSLRAQPRRST